jgi:hypothetical protein
MGRPGDAARMAKMRARRAPFTDPREGRLKRQVRRAFRWSGGKPLTTTQLVKQCYWAVNFEEIKSWHRPRKMARPGCPTAVQARAMVAAVGTARQEGRKTANTHANSGFIWGIPVKKAAAGIAALSFSFESARSYWINNKRDTRTCL